MSASSSDAPRWTRGQRRLHWWSAGLLLLAFALSFLMTALPFSQLLAKFLAYQLHKTFGLLVLALLAWRLVLRRRAVPAHPGLSPGHRRAARVGQGVLYGLLLVVPLLGYLTAQLAPGPVPTTLFLVIPVPHILAPDPVLFGWVRPVHQAAAWALVIAACGHAAMAWWHRRQGIDLLR